MPPDTINPLMVPTKPTIKKPKKLRAEEPKEFSIDQLASWERLGRGDREEKLWPGPPLKGQVTDNTEIWVVGDTDHHEWRFELRSRGGLGNFVSPRKFKFLTAEQRRPVPPSSGSKIVLAFDARDSTDPSHIECRQIWPLLAKYVFDKVRAEPWGNRSGGIVKALNDWKHHWPKPKGFKNAYFLQGLFGELYLLNWLLEHRVSADVVLGAWVGPDKQVHDFHFQRCHVEVKANAGKRRSVTISDLRQLDESCAGGRVLFLAYIGLDKTREKENSLSRLKEKVEEKLNDQQKHRLSEKLRNARWFQIDPLDRDKTIFSVRYPELFMVIDGFPRLLREDIQKLKSRDVTVMKYRIIVPNDGEFSLTAEAFIAKVK